jgi:putative cell wall-binding protein
MTDRAATVRSYGRRAFLRRAGVVGLGALSLTVSGGGPLHELAGLVGSAAAGDGSSAPEVRGARLAGLPTASTDEGLAVSAPTEMSMPFSMVGFDVPGSGRVAVRTSTDGESWGAWTQARPESDEVPDPDGGERVADPEGMTEPVWVGAARWLQLRVTGGRPEDVGVHLIDSMGLSEGAGGQLLGALGALVAPDVAHAAVQPGIVSRAQWGADESLRSGGATYAPWLELGFIHHTVTGNSYTHAQAPGVMRGMYAYHTRSRGWKDIGYNFCVDRFGTIYEGRYGGADKAVVGAHAGGFNYGSFGAAFIGTLDTAEPTAAARESMARLFVWKCGLYGIDPFGTVARTSSGSSRYSSGRRVTLSTVSGHRDVSLTGCPGSAAYATLESVRSRVAELSTTPEPRALRRIGGRDGIGTAVLVSKAAFPEHGSATRAVIATEKVFADAAAGGPLAAGDGPVLLTGDGLDDRVLAELRRVLPAGLPVFLLGSEAALSKRVEDALGDRWSVHRFGGANRVHTAALVAEQVVKDQGRRVALIARGFPNDAWHDGLTAGAYGARHGTPVLLTRPDRLSPETAKALRDLRIERTAVIGGPSAVSDEVLRRLPDPTRVSGSHREATAVAVAEQLWDRRDTVILAGGFKDNAWKDALVSAPLAARLQAPVVLTRTDSLPPATVSYLESIPTAKGYVIGGTGAIQEGVAEHAAKLLA